MRSYSVTLNYSTHLPSGAVVGVAPICSVEQLPCDPSDGSISARRRCEIHSWHSVARHLLQDPTAQFSYNDVGAPQIVNSPLYISVSHSQHLVAVIVSPLRAAIDIESQERNFERVASKYISSSEEQQLANTPRLLAKVWSIKETAYKYAGCKELRLLEDIMIESIEDESFTASLRGGERFEGQIAEIMEHTLTYVG